MNQLLFSTIDKTLEILFVRNRDAASEKLFGRKSSDLQTIIILEKKDNVKSYSAVGQQTSN
jgi:hypothetical protein